MISRSIRDVCTRKWGESQVKGWVKSVRKHKKFSFITVNDGSCWDSLQVVVQTEMLPENVTTGCSVIVDGSIQEAKNSVELLASNVTVIGECDSSAYPLQKKYHTPEFMREIIHLRSRSNRMGAVLRVRSAAFLKVHEFFAVDNFIHVNTPILTSIDCEGAGEMFKVSSPLENQVSSYLTVSGQLHAEIFSNSLQKVYTFGPTFRAENSNTSRHLSEFWMLEPEVAFHSSSDSMTLAENCVKHILQGLYANYSNDIENLYSITDDRSLREKDLQNAIERPFIRLSYNQAIDILQKSERDFMMAVVWGYPLQSEHERYLTEEYGCRTPIFVTDFPAACKAFYMKRIPENPNHVACFDLLFPRIGELIGGSAREDNLELLHRRMLAKLGSEASEKLEWYLDLRRFGSVPHAGWGMGFERFVQFVTGVENIRDTIPIPRTPGAICL